MRKGVERPVVASEPMDMVEVSGISAPKATLRDDGAFLLVGALGSKLGKLFPLGFVCGLVKCGPALDGFGSHSTPRARGGRGIVDGSQVQTIGAQQHSSEKANAFRDDDCRPPRPAKGGEDGWTSGNFGLIFA